MEHRMLWTGARAGAVQRRAWHLVGLLELVALGLHHLQGAGHVLHLHLQRCLVLQHLRLVLRLDLERPAPAHTTP